MQLDHFLDTQHWIQRMHRWPEQTHTTLLLRANATLQNKPRKTDIHFKAPIFASKTHLELTLAMHWPDHKPGQKRSRAQAPALIVKFHTPAHADYMGSLVHSRISRLADNVQTFHDDGVEPFLRFDFGSAISLHMVPLPNHTNGGETIARAIDSMLETLGPTESSNRSCATCDVAQCASSAQADARILARIQGWRHFVDNIQRFATASPEQRNETLAGIGESLSVVVAENDLDESIGRHYARQLEECELAYKRCTMDMLSYRPCVQGHDAADDTFDLEAYRTVEYNLQLAYRDHLSFLSLSQCT